MKEISYRAELERIMPGDHVAGIATGDEQIDLLAAYIAHGHAKKEICPIAITPPYRKRVSDAVGEYGLDFEKLVAEGDVIVIDPNGFVGSDGKIKLTTYYQAVVDFNNDMKKKNIPHARITGLVVSFSHLLRKRDELVLCSHMDRAYTPGACVSGFCIFDSSRMASDLLVQVIRSHPKAWMKGRLVENPFYKPTAEILAEAGGTSA